MSMARDEHNRNARREVLKKVLRGAGLMGLVGAIWGGMAIYVHWVHFIRLLGSIHL